MPIFQPQLQDRSAPTYIKPGVVDKSTAGLISDLGGMALDAYKGYQIADIERQQEETMNAYLTGNVEHFDPAAQQAIDEAGKDVGIAAIAEEEAWNLAAKTPEGAFDAITSAEQNLAKSQKKLSAALEQGVITGDEFNARIMSNLREAINRNPGFEQELVNQTRRVMEYSGMSDFMKLVNSQKDAASEQAKQMMGIYVDAIKQAEVSPEDFGGDLRAAGEYAIRINAERKQVTDAKAQLEMLKGRGELNRQIVDQVVASPNFGKSMSVDLAMLHSNISRNMESGAYLVNKPAHLSDTDAQLIGIKQNIESSRALVRSMIAQGSEASRPALNDYMKQLDAIEALHSDIALGKYDAAKKTAMLAAAEASYKLPLAQGDAQTTQLNKLMSTLEHLKNATGMFPEKIDQGFINQLGQQIQQQIQYVQGYAPAPLAGVDLSTSTGQKVAITSMALIQPDTAIGMSAEKAIGTNSATINGVLRQFNDITDKKQYSQLTDLLVEQINSNTTRLGKPVSSMMDEASGKALSTHLETSIGQIARVGAVHYDASLNKFTVVDSSGKMLEEPTRKFNKMATALHSVKGLTGDVDIDTFGADLARIAKEGRRELTGIKPITQQSPLTIRETGGTEPGTWSIESGTGASKNWWED